MRWLIRAENLSVGYSNNIVAGKLSIEINQSDFVAILGPNGSGKTTLLKTLVGALPPVDGTIRRNFENFSYLPQETDVEKYFPIDVEDVILMGLFKKTGILFKKSKEVREKIEDTLKILELSDKRKTPFGHLSGGEKQKVLLGRCIVSDPEIVFLDEPTSALDIKAKKELMETVAEIVKKLEIAVIVVTHDFNNVLKHATKLIVVSNGRIIAGRPEEILQKEVLSELYGVDVEIFRVGRDYCVVVGDHHISK